jgi:hypothetical protein
MSYQTIHRNLARHEIGVGMLLLAAFLVAVPLMFIHPTGALALFGLSLIVLLVAVILDVVMRWMQRRAAVDELRHHSCPSCGARMVDPSAPWACEQCGTSFDSTGVERT